MDELLLEDRKKREEGDQIKNFMMRPDGHIDVHKGCVYMCE